MKYGGVLSDEIVDNKLGWDVQNYREASIGVRIWVSGVKSVKEIENVKVDV